MCDMLLRVKALLEDLQQDLPSSCEQHRARIKECLAEVSAALVPKDEATPGVLKERAAAAFKANDFAAALSLCDRAIALEPREATHHANRSLALLRLGDTGDSVAAAEAAVALNPAWGKAHFRLGMARQGAGDYQGAARALQVGSPH